MDLKGNLDNTINADIKNVINTLYNLYIDV